MSKIRPSSLDIPTWNRGTFPFDAFEWQDPQKNAAPHLKLRSPWVLELSAGTVDTDEIADGAVTNVKVNAAAEISASKIKLTEITSLGNLASAPSLSGLTGSQLAAAANIAGTQLADDTIPESKITAATLTSKSLKFTDNIHENDDPLPDGDKLLDCIMPSAKWSDGTEPEDTKNIVFEPWYIGSVLNPRVKTNFHGAIGVWKATTNYLTNPEDWTVYTGGGGSLTVANYYYSQVAKTCTHMITTGANGWIYKRYERGSSTAGTWTFSMLVLSDSAQDFYMALTDGTAYKAEAISNVVAGLNVVSITAVLNDASKTKVDVIIENYKTSDGTDNRGAFDIAILQSQLEESAYATPFTPSTRAAGSLTYANAQPSVITFEKWVCPGGSYNYSGVYMLFRQGSLTADDDLLRIYYDGTTQRWNAVINNGADRKMKISNSAIASDAAFRTWQHIHVIFDIPNQSVRFWWNGTEQTATNDSGDVSACAPGNYLAIGYDPCNAGRILDGLICDLRISSTADTSTAHYTVGRPYYDESSLPCANFGARLSATGLDLYRGSIDIVDQYGREILISNRHGLKAKDACGEIIHDIPNAIMSADWKYAGHIILRDTGDTALTSIAQGYIDTNTSRTWTSSTTNTDLSSLVGNLTIRAIIATCINTISLASAKQSAGCFLLATAQYASSYGGTPLVYNSMGIARHYIEAPIAALLDVVTVTPDVIVPVFYSSGVPYVTWNLSATWSGMTASSAAYDVSSLLVIKGFLV